MTMDQLRLHFFWQQRDEARRQRIDERAVQRAITRSVWGKDPDTGSDL